MLTPAVLPPRYALVTGAAKRLGAAIALELARAGFDIASAVRFAVENPAMTGITLVVDGGQHLMPFERDFSVMSR